MFLYLSRWIRSFSGKKLQQYTIARNDESSVGTLPCKLTTSSSVLKWLIFSCISLCATTSCSSKIRWRKQQVRHMEEELQRYVFTMFVTDCVEHEYHDGHHDTSLEKPPKLMQMLDSDKNTKTTQFWLQHVTLIPASLHWLLIYLRIDFKLVLFIIDLAPLDLTDCLFQNIPNPSFRSSNTDLLLKPEIMHTKHLSATIV